MEFILIGIAISVLVVGNELISIKKAMEKHNELIEKQNDILERNGKIR